MILRLCKKACSLYLYVVKKYRMSDIQQDNTKLAQFTLFFEEVPLFGKKPQTRLVRQSKKQ